MIRAFAPGRVNVIGDHTDYTGGLVLPCAINFGTTVTFEPGGSTLELVSADEPEPASVAVPVHAPESVSPAWARYPAAVAAELRATTGGRVAVETTLPIGAGLSSSAALEVAVALALGYEGSTTDLALLCQRAEQRAVGVPTGVMDQLASAAGIGGALLLIDCTTLEVTPVPLPGDVAIVVVDSAEPRALAGSEYAERRAACEAAIAEIGPLRAASMADVERVSDPVARRRARHVVTENLRVAGAAAALGAGEPHRAGEAMIASHASLRDNFEVSTPALDSLVERLAATEGVYGARLTGAGFGGCVVALVTASAAETVAESFEGWVVRPSPGARVTTGG